MEINVQSITVVVPESHDVSKPLPLRLTPSDKPNLWATSDGRRVFVSEEWAIKSMEMDTPEYRDRRRKRMELGQLVRAEVVDEYNGWVTTTGDEDDYAADIAELLEKHAEKWEWAGIPESETAHIPPAWAFCCTESGFEFDLESQLDCYLSDNHHEEARDSLVDEKELWDFWTAWVAKQTGLRSYLIDTKRIVVIDRDRYETEVADAKAWLEENV